MEGGFPLLLAMASSRAPCLGVSPTPWGAEGDGARGIRKACVRGAGAQALDRLEEAGFKASSACCKASLLPLLALLGLGLNSDSTSPWVCGLRPFSV